MSFGVLKMMQQLRKAWDESAHPRNPSGTSSGGEFTSGGGEGIVAYHGTGAKFSQFKASRIGGGTGSGALGYGLYFTEEPKVAEEYKERLSRRLQDPSGKLVELPSGAYPRAHVLDVIGILKEHSGDYKAAIRNLLLNSRSGESTVKEYVDMLRDWQGKGLTLAPDAGSVYSVKLDVSPDKLLDFDAKLSEQSPYIQNVLKEHGLWDKVLSWAGKTATGGDVMRYSNRMVQQVGEGNPTGPGYPKEHSDYLRSIGIEGTRAEDNDSPQANGAHTLVVFDDSKVRITHRNGKPVKQEELAKAMEDITKAFDPGQPRDEDGKWTGSAGVAQTESSRFKQWFGQSKIVDSSHRPLVMYHGTAKAGFSQFKDGLNYFTQNPAYANNYTHSSYSAMVKPEAWHKAKDAPAVLPVYLKIEKPFDTRDAQTRRIFEREFYGNGSENWQSNGTPLDESTGLPDWTDAEDLYAFLKEKGYDFDGLVLSESGGNITFATFEPTQIKSATGNNGRFDPKHADIAKSQAPLEPMALVMERLADDDMLDLFAKSFDESEHPRDALGRFAQEQGGGNLDQEQAKINSPQFKAWFGDSKIVDEQGKPLVVYHGGKRFNEFKGDYFFSSKEIDVASTFASQHDQSEIKPLYLRMERPLDLTDPATSLQWYGADHTTGPFFRAESNMAAHFKEDPAMFARAKQAGYDGIIYHGQNLTNGYGGICYIFWKPEQAKLAENPYMDTKWGDNPIRSEENSGAYDRNSRDVSKSFDESEHPRDEIGRFTSGSGGSGSGTQMVSPSVEENTLSFEQSVQRFVSQRQKQFDTECAKIDEFLGAKAKVQNAVGAWTDGTENSTVQIMKGLDYNTLKYSAALKALYGEQKAAVVFQAVKGGPARMYELHVNHEHGKDGWAADGQALAKMMDKAGIQNYTLLQAEHGTTIMVFDQKNELGQKMQQAVKIIGKDRVHSRQRQGIGELIGDTETWDRSKAPDIYREMIERHESRTGKRYQYSAKLVKNFLPNPSRSISFYVNHVHEGGVQ